ncbi:MAG: M48 family metallopeptidase [Dehalococcoidia bacterium]|nr:M48 family metallopeptidase [Dehalococcoidia bacterium]
MRPAHRALERAEHGVVERDGIVVAFRVIRSARRRRTIELTLEPDGVRVAAPLRTPTSEVEEFVRSRIPWIQKHREKGLPGVMPTPSPASPASPGSSGAGDVRDASDGARSLPFLGRPLPLEVVAGAGKTTRISMDMLGLRVAVPARLEAPAQQVEMQDALRTWYRERAGEVIGDRVAAWQERAGYRPSRVLIRDQRRRWGSCAPDGTLRFNWRLVMLEPRLIDYVVVHELAHLVRPHHRPSFWAEVERLMPDYRARRAALREAGATLPL